MSNSTRICRSCGAAYPETSEYFSVRDSRGRDKYYPECRKCLQAKPQKAPKGLKVCRQCGELKPRTLEFFRSNGRSGLFKPVCKSCLNIEREVLPLGQRRCIKCRDIKPATKDFFYAAGPGRLRGTCIFCLNKESVAWQKNNPHRMLLIWQRRDVKHRERRRAGARERYARNPYRVLAHQGKRRMRAESSPTQFSKEDVERKYTQQKGRCYWCGGKLGGRYHVDHVIALAKGGTNGPENICCSCPTCNLRKKAKYPWEFNGRLL